MILEFFVEIAFGMIDYLTVVIKPFMIIDGGTYTDFFSVAVGLIQSASMFMPMDIICLAIGNILYWYMIHLIISIIKFILDFLPFF